MEIIPETNVEESGVDLDMAGSAGESIGMDDPVSHVSQGVGKVPLLTAEQEQIIQRECLKATTMRRICLSRLTEIGCIH